MSEQCGIVRDLLPLCHDGVASDESRALVGAHLKTCEGCRGEMEKIKAEFKPGGLKKPEQAKVEALKRFKAKLWRKNVIVGAVSAVLALIALSGAYWGVFVYETPIKYHDGMLTVNLAVDEVLDVYCNDGRYARARGIERQIIRGGAPATAVYLNYTGTLWTRRFAEVTDRAQTQFSIGWAVMADFGGGGGISHRISAGEGELDGNGQLTVGPFKETGDPEISAVYYLDGDFGDGFRDLIFTDSEEFARLAEGAVLLWER
ncbi:MAG: zf-HC2 domain-containing protein [Gracilibacteraceae bacterium]|jgi:hypothetical protein|nr:zf-HC2 domain-containing protein [Gracilibacteraceae bacterium]